MNGQLTHLPVICSVLNIPYGNNYKKKAAISQRFFMAFCALSSAKGMDIKMNIHKDKMLWYNTSYCIRVSYERS